MQSHFKGGAEVKVGIPTGRLPWGRDGYDRAEGQASSTSPYLSLSGGTSLGRAWSVAPAACGMPNAGAPSASGLRPLSPATRRGASPAPRRGASPSSFPPSTEVRELQAALEPLQVDEFTCQRFLNANEGNVRKAVKQYRTFLAWRERERIDEVLLFCLHHQLPTHPP